MNQEHPENSAEQKMTGPGACGPEGSRRKLIQAGLVGAPVLLALKSTPVLAANCKNPSGFSVSGNLSHTYTTCSPKLNGVTYWQSNLPAAQQTVLFSSVFTSGSSPMISNLTLQDALLRGASDINAKIVAAYLSAPTSGVLDQATVVTMWNQGVKGTGYSPTPGATPWNMATVSQYLDYILA